MLFDPSISRDEALSQRDLWLPVQDPSQSRIVAVASAHALWARGVVALQQGFVRNRRDYVDEIVDADQLVRTEIERFVVVGPHDAANTLHAIVDIHERPCLFTVTPDLDLASVRK